MSHLVNNGLIKSIGKTISICQSCQIGKSHALSHSSRTTIYSPLALIFADIWGPSPVKSYNGHSYYVNFVDAATNFNWIFPMFKKSDIYGIFDKFYRWAERYSGKRILAMQTDNACEFQKLGRQLAKLGI